MNLFNADTKARKTTAKRLFAILIIFGVALSYLIFNLFNITYFKHDYYSGKAYDQITTSAPLRAKRGNIYDGNMNLLATTRTVWRVFISTREIKKATKRDGSDYGSLIATGLSKILSLDENSLLTKIKNSSVLDVTVKKSVSEDEYNRVLDFIKENSLEKLVFTEAQTSRYYPEQKLAAHVLGFTGSDNQGLYGLEYYYDSTLKGKDGYYLYAKDANGNALSNEYSSYVDAINGASIVTTIDSYVQRALESQLESIRINHQVQNRVAGIVMDTTTGAILAMATSSPFNPNSPYQLDSLSLNKLLESGYAEGSEEYKKLKTELLQIMWSNKAVSETYEPGSTFKIITVSAALDSGAVSTKDTFSCKGFHEVGGWRIKCHKVTGHGSGFSLAYGLQMSCNPTMMKIAEKIGAEKFYSYIEGFGYLEKTGIDLPSEAGTIFHNLEGIGPTELATISFGQRFKVSIISQLTAVAAVANGGKLVTPYLVKKVIDENGNVITEHETEVKNQVISAEVAKTVSDILEKGVSGDGGAKNAAVDGYKVAAKTGTSQKFDVLDENGNSYLRIGSTVAYAPSDNAGIAVIIVVDEPTTAVKYGSVVAAPYISALLESVLPYLDYKSNGENSCVEIKDYRGRSVSEVKKELEGLKVDFEIIGNGDTVVEQTPNATVIDASKTRLILYTSKPEDTTVTVPNFVNMQAYEANILAGKLGLSAVFLSDYNLGAGTTIVISQSISPGTEVKKGSAIRLSTAYVDFED